MKILFLDVDGVLNYDKCKARCGSFRGIESEKVALLKQIIDATGALIVLTSSWRHGLTHERKDLQNAYKYLKKKLDKYYPLRL